MKKEIRICGFGGQGVILSGFIIGKAAAVFMDYHAVQSQSYGPEARGGAARSEIVISDKKIGYPRPTSVDLLVSMSQEAFDSYRDDIRDDTVIVVDPDLVPDYNIGKSVYTVRAQKIAEELISKEYFSPLITRTEKAPIHLVNEILNYLIDSKIRNPEIITFCTMNLILSKIRKTFGHDHSWKNRYLNVIRNHLLERSILDYTHS